MECGLSAGCAAGGQHAALLRVTALDTGDDFVSLYDGDSAEAPRLAQLSGSSAPAGAFGARGGELLVVFESDRDTVADGFAAEYWCGPAARLGPSERAALEREGAELRQPGQDRQHS